MDIISISITCEHWACLICLHSLVLQPVNLALMADEEEMDEMNDPDMMAFYSPLISETLIPENYSPFIPPPTLNGEPTNVTFSVVMVHI